jgi:ATP-dependent helicase/nuclease subunit B
MILEKKQTSSINDKENKLAVEDKIEALIKSGNPEKLLIIVPTNRKLRRFKKEIIDKSPNQSVSQINIETLTTFSSKLYYLDSDFKQKILSNPASTVLLSQCFSEVELKYFSHYKKEAPFGTVERIRDVISEYKRHGISPETLINEAANLTGSEKLKAEDISRLFSNYQKKCLKLGLMELGDIYDAVNQITQSEFQKRFRTMYPDVQLISVQGFDEFSTPEINLLNAASNLTGVKLYITFDYSSDNYFIFSHLDKCYSKLKDAGFVLKSDEEKHPSNQFQDQIRALLFNSHTQKGIGQYKNLIKKVTAETRENEIELIAKEIKQLLTNGKAQPHQICVAFNLIQNYSPLVRDVFSLFGVPFNLTDRFSLKTSPPVIALINLLEILENDFYYKNIFRALSGGIINLPGFDLSNLLKASSKLKVISGYENWKSSLTDAINSKYEEDDDAAISEKDKEVFKKALSDLELLYELLEPFNKHLKLNEFYNKLQKLLYKIDLPSRVINSESLIIEENLKAITVFTETIKELIELLALEYSPAQKFPLKFYLKHIKTAVSSSRYNIKEKPGYGVLVTTINEIRGLKFKYLFLGGMVDGEFPTRYTPEIFFSGHFVKKEIAHQTEERYHFYQSLCSWEEGLYFSLPKHDEKQEMVESNFLTEFAGLFDIGELNKSDYSNFIFSKEELLKFLGSQPLEKIPDTIKVNLSSDELKEISRAIQIESRRNESPFEESDFTGYVSEEVSDKAKDELKNYLHRDYSISQLETYAKCPYKYFAERVLKLETYKEPTEEIEALEMGSLIHNILYTFYAEIHQTGLRLQSADDEQFKKAEEIMFRIAEEKVARANFNSPLTFYEKEKILGIDGKRKSSVLYKFLEAERIESEEFLPAFFEIIFGKMGSGDSKLSELKIDDVSVRGKIDRIDLNTKDKLYKVVDYKLSGRNISKDDLEHGLELQLPLYMYAARELIKAELNYEYQPAGAEIYSLKFAESDFGKKNFTLPKYGSQDKTPIDKIIERNEALVSACLNAVKKYVTAISEGKFNLSTLKDRENKICRLCDFKLICRIEEVS